MKVQGIHITRLRGLNAEMEMGLQQLKDHFVFHHVKILRDITGNLHGIRQRGKLGAQGRDSGEVLPLNFFSKNFFVAGASH